MLGLRCFFTKMNLIVRVIPVFLVALLVACGNAGPIDGQLEKASLLENKGDRQGALVTYKAILQSDPSSTKARMALADFYRKTGFYDQAEIEAKKARDYGADKAKVAVFLARIALQKEIPDQALMEIATDKIPDADITPEIRFLRGMAYLTKNQPDDASAQFDKALEIDGKYPLALAGKARLAMKMGDQRALLMVDDALLLEKNNPEILLLKADILREKMQLKSALDTYYLLLEQNPYSIAAYTGAIAIHIETGDVKEARRILQKMGKYLPNLPLYSYAKATIELHENKLDVAERDIGDVLKVAPKDPAARFVAGVISLRRQDYRRAESFLSPLLLEFPNLIVVRKLLARMYISQNEHDKASAILGLGTPNAKMDADMLVLAGEVEMAKQNYTEAIKNFNQAIGLNKNQYQGRMGLAMSNIALGNQNQAVDHLLSATQYADKPGQADEMLARLYAYKKEYEKSISILKAAISRNQNDPSLYNSLAAIYVEKKDMPMARKNLEKALQLKGNYLPAVKNLVRLHLENKDPANARKVVDLALKSDPQNVQALLLRSELSLEPGGGGGKDMLDWLIKANKADPQSLDPYLLLTRYFMLAGDFKQASYYATNGLARLPTSPAAMENLANVQLASGDVNAAIANLQKWVAQQPSSILARQRLSSALLANGDSRAAREVLRKALELHPDSEALWTDLVALEIRAKAYDTVNDITDSLIRAKKHARLGYALRGDAEMLQGNYRKAIELYNHALSIRRDSMLLVKWYESMCIGGLCKEADIDVAKWLAANVTDDVVRMAYADSLIRRGESMRAVDLYKEVLVRQPNNYIALNNVAYELYKRSDPAALRYADSAYRSAPSNPLVLDTYGVVLLANHKVELALDLLLKSARVAPNNFDNRIHLAEAFVVKGDLVRAKQELANAQRLNRNYSNDSAYLSVEKKLASAGRLKASEAR